MGDGMGRQGCDFSGRGRIQNVACVISPSGSDRKYSSATEGGQILYLEKYWRGTLGEVHLARKAGLLGVSPKAVISRVKPLSLDWHMCAHMCACLCMFCVGASVSILLLYRCRCVVCGVCASRRALHQGDWHCLTQLSSNTSLLSRANAADGGGCFYQIVIHSTSTVWWQVLCSC